MELLKKVLKTKLFYVVLATIFVVNSAMNANRKHNADLLGDYYSPSMDTVAFGETLEEDAESHAAVISDDLREKLVTYAKKFRGRPYKYAAKGPSQFDCSGFTCFVYKEFDIKLPASSRLQSEFGEAIDLDETQAGDLLLFKSPTKGVERIGHVGIVVSNDNEGVKFIHSSTGRGVVIDNLTKSKHYQSRYRAARRVLND